MFVTIFGVFLGIFWPKNIASRDGCVLLIRKRQTTHHPHAVLHWRFWSSILAGAKEHPKTQHTRKRRRSTVPRICVFGCVAFSGVFWRPPRGEQRAPENATHPKTQILGTVDCLRFRVCCVFGCSLFSSDDYVVWALFSTETGEKIRRGNPRKKSGGSKIKIREKSILPKSDPNLRKKAKYAPPPCSLHWRCWSSIMWAWCVDFAVSDILLTRSPFELAPQAAIPHWRSGFSQASSQSPETPPRGTTKVRDTKST